MSLSKQLIFIYCNILFRLVWLGNLYKTIYKTIFFNLFFLFFLFYKIYFKKQPIKPIKPIYQKD